MGLRIVAALLAAGLAANVSSQSEPKIILGVLEDTQYYPNDTEYRSVRVVFEKRGNDWLAFDSDCPDQNCGKKFAPEVSGEITWTIAFDGRNLGQVTTHPGDFKPNASIGQQQITSQGPVPIIGKKSREFGGFLDAVVYRPLVAVSQPNCKDPDVWKRAHPTDDVIAISRRQFRKKFPNVINCMRQNEEATNAKPWSYSDKNIEIRKTYASKRGWWLLNVRLGEYRCDGPTDDAFDDQWFVIDPQRSAKFLGAGMRLVDAGDYDNDGKSEVLFATDQYNRGGYILFYDDFRKHATFEFSYH